MNDKISAELSPTIINYEDNKTIELLKNTVAQGATDDEFKLFAELCKSTGLNPFKKEIWFIKTKGYTNNRNEFVDGKVQIMTGINGFLAIANRHPKFDGMTIKIEEDKNGLPQKAICSVYRKDRKYPSTATALYKEFYKKSRNGNGIWETMPSIMLAKCAKSLALREAFPQELNGLYTQEEMPVGYGQLGNGVPSLDDDAEGAEQRPAAPYKVNTQGSTGRIPNNPIAPKPTAPLKTDAQQVLSDVEKAVKRVQEPKPPQFYYYYFPGATPATDEALKKKGGVYNLETCCWRMNRKLSANYDKFEVDLNTYCNRGKDPVDQANI